MSRISKLELLIVVFCLIGGFVLRFYSFDKKSLWFDEIYTFQDSRYGFTEQLRYYEERPTYFHPPLFYLLTHLFYPFSKPERDLRTIPLIFGTLSIPLIYVLSRQFSRRIALPCTLVLTFMTYHIALSQDGRSYTLIMFFGMAALYFFMRHLITGARMHLASVAFCFALMFCTGYNSIPFIGISQLLWFYQPEEQQERPRFSSFLLMNALILILCVPWTTFLLWHYKGQSLTSPLDAGDPGSFWTILYGVLHDWVPLWPLMAVSIALVILLPFVLKNKRNGLLLLTIFLLPIAGLCLYVTLFHVTHFISSRYFINFLPLFFISLFLSLDDLELKLERLKRFLRLRIIFVILFIASNLIILPLYYRAEKQDNRGLAAYLKANLRPGDKVFIQNLVFLPGILHYLGFTPETRHYHINSSEIPGGGVEYAMPVTFQNRTFSIHHSKTCCNQYTADGGRIWIVVGKYYARELKDRSPAVFKGYFDGSFLNFNRFPTDASFYVFLFDPGSPDEKGIEMPIE